MAKSKNYPDPERLLREYKMLDSELPDISWAVFNRSTHDRRVARRLYIAEEGLESYKKHILPFERAGIMSIFKVAASPETALYIYLLGRQADRRLAKSNGVHVDE